MNNKPVMTIKTNWFLFAFYVWAGVFFLATAAFPAQSRKVTATAGSPIPTAYSSTDVQSLLWSSANTGNKHVHINNTTSSEIACILNAPNTTAVPADAGLISEAILIPASTQYVFDDFPVSKRGYCRSNTGSTITSGSVYVHVW